MANTPVALWAMNGMDVVNTSGGSSGASFIDCIAVVNNPIFQKRGVSDFRVWHAANLSAGIVSMSLSGSGTNGADSNLSLATMFVSHKLFWPSGTIGASGDVTIARIVSGTSTLKLELRLNSNGKLSAYDAASSLLGTGTTVLAAGTEYVIDMKANNAASGSGVWEIRINGVSELSGTTANLGAGTNASRFMFGNIANALASAGILLKQYEVWIDSSDYAPAGYQVGVLGLSGNGSPQSWTGGTGSSDYTQIDDGPGVDVTDYVQDPASGSTPVIGLFALATFANANYGTSAIPAGSTVYAIKAEVLARDASTAVTNTFNVGIKSNATTSLTNNRSTPASSVAPDNLAKLLTTDPNGGGSWTQAAVEAAFLVIQENTATVNTQVFQGHVTVAYVAPGSTTFTQSASVAVTAVPAVVRRVARSTTLAITTAATAAVQKVFLKAASVAITATLAVVRRAGAVRSVTASAALAVQSAVRTANSVAVVALPASVRRVARASTVSVTTTATAAVQKVFLKAASVAVTVGASATRVTGAIRTVAVTATVAVRNRVATAATATVTITAATVRRVTHSSTAAVTVTAAGVARRAFLVTAHVAVTVSASIITNVLTGVSAIAFAFGQVISRWTSRTPRTRWKFQAVEVRWQFGPPITDR